MNTPFSSHAWRALQSRAAAQLPPDFADRVLRQTRPTRASASPFVKWVFSPFTVSSFAAALCLLVVVLVQSHHTKVANDQHLAAWQEISRQLEPIKSEFSEQLDALLTEEQREKLKVLNVQVASASVSNPSDNSAKKPQDSLNSLLPIVIVPSTLERLSAELRLDGGQKAAVQALLLKRRTRFLEVVDTSPPPGLQLRKIAPVVPQIAQPSSK